MKEIVVLNLMKRLLSKICKNKINKNVDRICINESSAITKIMRVWPS